MDWKAVPAWVSWLALAILLTELVGVVAMCIRLQRRALAAVMELNTELPKATERCLKIGAPGLIVIGLLVAVAVIAVNVLRRERLMVLLLNLVGMVLVATGYLLFCAVLQLPFQDPIDLI